MAKIRLALFASGNGSNALKIMNHFSTHSTIEVGFLLSNKKDAPVVKATENKGVKVITLSNEEVANGSLLVETCIAEKIDLIILAGFLRKIPSQFTHHFSDKIINIHPALLPKHGGQGMYGKFVHEAVIKNKDSETGITIHYVNEHFDEGRIIAQFHCVVDSTDTVETIQGKIQQLEHAYFPFVIEQTINLEMI